MRCLVALPKQFLMSAFVYGRMAKPLNEQRRKWSESFLGEAVVQGRLRSFNETE
jgi:hypothetical protein